MNNIFDDNNQTNSKPNGDEFDKLFNMQQNQANEQGGGFVQNSAAQANANGGITLSMEQLAQLMKLAAQGVPNEANTQSSAPSANASNAANSSFAPSSAVPGGENVQSGENAEEKFSPKDPGTRVVFQDDSFVDEPRKRTPYANYDEDDIFNDQSRSSAVISNVRNNQSKNNSARGSYTVINAQDDRFSLAEAEYNTSDLPQLKSQVRTNYIPKNNSNAPFVLSGGSGRVQNDSFRLDEFEMADPNAKMQSQTQSQAQQTGLTKLSGGEKARRIILAIAIVAIILSGAYLVREYILHKKNEELESEISNLIVSVEETQSTTKSSKKSDKTKQSTTKAAATSSTQAAKTPEQQWEEIKAEFPSVAFPNNLQLKYARLYGTNTNFAGYLEAEGISMSLPVVQTAEDDAVNTYLKRNFYGKATKYGCPFVSSFNTIAKGELDYNTVIYGHHMNDRTIFGALDKYKTIDGFKSCPVIHFNTLYDDHSWKVIAAIITNDDVKDDNGYKFEYSFVDLKDDETKQSYLNELLKRSIYDTGVDVNSSDKLLTLSTCSHEFDNARLVIVARLLRPGESEAVDVTLAVNNENPRYPQAYYKAKRKDNPYKDDIQWYPE